MLENDFEDRMNQAVWDIPMSISYPGPFLKNWNDSCLENSEQH